MSRKAGQRGVLGAEIKVGYRCAHVAREVRSMAAVRQAGAQSGRARLSEWPADDRELWSEAEERMYRAAVHGDVKHGLAIRSRDMVTGAAARGRDESTLGCGSRMASSLIWGSDERDEFGWVRLNASIESCASA